MYLNNPRAIVQMCLEVGAQIRPPAIWRYLLAVYWLQSSGRPSMDGPRRSRPASFVELEILNQKDISLQTCVIKGSRMACWLSAWAHGWTVAKVWGVRSLAKPGSCALPRGSSNHMNWQQRRVVSHMMEEERTDSGQTRRVHRCSFWFEQFHESCCGGSVLCNLLLKLAFDSKKPYTGLKNQDCMLHCINHGVMINQLLHFLCCISEPS